MRNLFDHKMSGELLVLKITTSFALRHKSAHIQNLTSLCMDARGCFAGVLFAGESRKTQCGGPSVEGSSSLLCVQGGIETQNSFGSIPKASCVYFEKFHGSTNQVIKWTIQCPCFLPVFPQELAVQSR